MRFPAITRTAVAAAFMATAAAAAPQSVAGFSPQVGEQFFKSTHGNDWSCASCHTADPRSVGKHAKTGKEIAPLAPTANPQRFTSPTSAIRR